MDEDSRKALRIILLSFFCVLVLPLLLLTSAGVRFFHPDSQPGSVWICEDPQIVLHVGGMGDWAEIEPENGGEPIRLEAYFGPGTSAARLYFFTPGGMSFDKDCLLWGERTGARNWFNITIEHDALFDGKYWQLKFTRDPFLIVNAKTVAGNVIFLAIVGYVVYRLVRRRRDTAAAPALTDAERREIEWKGPMR